MLSVLPTLLKAPHRDLWMCFKTRGFFCWQVQSSCIWSSITSSGTSSVCLCGPVHVLCVWLWAHPEFSIFKRRFQLKTVKRAWALFAQFAFGTFQRHDGRCRTQQEYAKRMRLRGGKVHLSSWFFNVISSNLWKVGIFLLMILNYLLCSSCSLMPFFGHPMQSLTSPYDVCMCFLFNVVHLSSLCL